MKSLKLRTILAGLLTVLFIIISGCSSDTNVPKVNEPSDAAKSSTAADGKTANAPAKSTEQKVKVYFPNADGTKLIAKEKAAASGIDSYTAAMQVLLQGSKDKSAITIIPSGTKLQCVKVENNIAYVSFNSAMVKNFNGGSTGELMLVSSIVNTLTEFPEIKAVQIMIEGKKVETLAGHLDLSEPLKRFSLN